MTTDGSAAPTPATEPWTAREETPVTPPAVSALTASTRHKAGKKTVGTAMAAVTLAAVTVLGGPVLVGGTASSLDPASIIGSPPNSVTSRIAGVHEDMARAVQLQQITSEQAAFLENQLVKRIQSEA